VKTIPLLATLFTAGQYAMNPGLYSMCHLDRLPYLAPGVTVHYEGSIDKRGNNADWDWWLYRNESSGEWVLMDIDGPGCLMNFVVHHALGHSDPVYRFYFDGADTPAFEIRHSEFGRKAPFIEPLGGWFAPDPSGDKRLLTLDFRIVRSFCPMAFRRGCRITSSVKLEGNASNNSGGGWGHVIYHTYPTDDGITTFTTEDDYTELLDLWRRCGDDPKPKAGNVATPVETELAPGESRGVYTSGDPGSIAAIRLNVRDYRRERLGELWIHLTWDGEATPAVSAPFGAFFGNEQGYHTIRTLMQSVSATGEMVSFWPMPFWRSATIALENRGAGPVGITGSIHFKPASVLAYPHGEAGHFRASAYQPCVAKHEGFDSHVATLTGCHGHMVAGIVTADSGVCEGDVRVHLDGSSTPDVESDGSESWACYGWGFYAPPQMNPASSYDGPNRGNWSMVRLLMGDFYPFESSLRMTVEGQHGHHGGTDRRSGLVFWYGEPGENLRQTDALDIGDSDSERAHAYEAPGSTLVNLTATYEGEFDQQEISNAGRIVPASSEFTIAIDPANGGVRLRRRSDQKYGRQRAEVFVDGRRVSERDWYQADRNPFHRWLDDSFEIPAAYTVGKSQVRIRLVNAAPGKGDAPSDRPVFPAPDERPAQHWSEFAYTVFSRVDSAGSHDR
jgi:hypothetical protein